MITAQRKKKVRATNGQRPPVRRWPGRPSINRHSQYTAHLCYRLLLPIRRARTRRLTPTLTPMSCFVTRRRTNSCFWVSRDSERRVARGSWAPGGGFPPGPAGCTLVPAPECASHLSQSRPAAYTPPRLIAGFTSVPACLCVALHCRRRGHDTRGEEHRPQGIEGIRRPAGTTGYSDTLARMLDIRSVDSSSCPRPQCAYVGDHR